MMVRPRFREPPEEIRDRLAVQRLEARMHREKAPEFCPVCFSLCISVEEQHPYGEGTVTEFLHWECERCGMVADCSRCGGFFISESTDHLRAEDKEVICLCPKYSTTPSDFTGLVQDGSKP